MPPLLTLFRPPTGDGSNIPSSSPPYTDLILHRAQFARRDNVFFNSVPVKEKNAFVIICTITSSPTTPPPPSPVPCRPVPKELLETLGSLLDDPVYSDVEFVFPRRRRSGRYAKKIYANRKLIERADYFKASE